MFGGGVSKVGLILHQLCHMTFHANEVMGPGAGVRTLLNHPFLSRHEPPSGRALDMGADQFWFGRELKPFWFLVFTDKESIQFHGNDEFKGFTGIALGKNKYMVALSKPLAGPFGKKARPLASWFIKRFDAIDTSAFGGR